MVFAFFSVVCTIVSVAVFAEKYSDFFPVVDHANFHFSFVFCVLSVVMACVAGLFMIIEMKKRSSYSPIWGKCINLTTDIWKSFIKLRKIPVDSAEILIFFTVYNVDLDNIIIFEVSFFRKIFEMYVKWYFRDNFVCKFLSIISIVCLWIALLVFYICSMHLIKIICYMVQTNFLFWQKVPFNEFDEILHNVSVDSRT